jgi:hypothetical protein
MPLEELILPRETVEGPFLKAAISTFTVALKDFGT